MVANMTVVHNILNGNDTIIGKGTLVKTEMLIAA